MCVRTSDTDLIAALDALEGKSALGPDGGKAAGLVIKTSPNRVLVSPIARVEVYAAIPGPGGESPMGPHTHMLPKLIASGRTHAANAPIPEGLQPVLSLHPGSPWRDAAGKKRGSFDPNLDAVFESILQHHALPDDRKIRNATENAVKTGTDPASYSWPTTRRARSPGSWAFMQSSPRFRSCFAVGSCRSADRGSSPRSAGWRSFRSYTGS